MRFLKGLIVLALMLGAQPWQALGAVDHWETIVYNTDQRSYLLPSGPLAANWHGVGFNDSSWPQGPGGIGYGDGDDNTTISATISVFQRLPFTVVDVSKIDQLVLNVDYDDAFVAYLNGVEIARANIGNVGTEPAWNDAANTWVEPEMVNGGYPGQYIIDAATLSGLLTNGNNVLAVQVHNSGPTSSDLSSLIWLHAGINDASNDYGNTPTWFEPPVVLTSSDLPILIINTSGQTIPDEPKITAYMGIIDNGPGSLNQITDPHNDYSGYIGVELRGSTSQSLFPKKGYGLETRDSAGNNNNVSLLGMPVENDWVLHNPYSDKTLMRNALQYELGRKTGVWTSRTRHCEVVLNGEYMGVYVLMEKIKRDANRVDLATLNPVDTVGDQLSGGYIVKIDKPTGVSSDGWTSPYAPWAGASQVISYKFHDPKGDELVPVQKNYIETYVTAFENAMAGPNFADSSLGYPTWIHTESFIDFMLLNEVSRNVDGYRLSTFLYKDRDSSSTGGKLRMGPLWDFNIALGNANYCDGGDETGWAWDFNQVCDGDQWQIPFWWEVFHSDTAFMNQARCRWEQLRTGPLHTDSVLAAIDSMALLLDEAQARNFQKWPTLGTYVWPNNATPPDYQGEIDYLSDWLTDRLNWIDFNLPGQTNWCTYYLDVEEREVPNQNLMVFPNPAEDRVFVEWPTGMQSNQAQVVVADAAGRLVETDVEVNADYIVLPVNHLPAGVYFITLSDGEKKSTGKVLVR